MNWKMYQIRVGKIAHPMISVHFWYSVFYLESP